MAEPKTKEQFRLDAPARRPAQTLRQTPPPIPKTASAHAGRDRLDESPLALDPKLAVDVARTLRDSAEITIDTANTDPLLMERTEFREFMRSAEYIDNRKNIDPNHFANSIMFSEPKSEKEKGPRYVLIRRDDGNTWRLYPQMEGLASVEKFEKCVFTATLRAGGKDYQLYLETPEPGKK